VLDSLVPPCAQLFVHKAHGAVDVVEKLA